MPATSTPRPASLLLAAAIAAATAPSLLAWNVSPSPTFLNQALALLLWGLFVAASAPAAGAAAGRGPAPLWMALALLAGAVLWSWGPGLLPASLALSALGLLAAAALLVAAGAAAGRRHDAVQVFVAFCVAWLVAGLLAVVVALIQVFAPALADGTFIARSGHVGRAVGNLRQPNHLSTLLLWAVVATVALAELRRLPWRAAAGLLAALVLAVVLTGSRTGGVGVALLLAWALADGRLSRPARWLLGLGAPLAYAGWSAVLALRHLGASARLGEADLSSSRLAIWADTLTLLRQQPWGGVGFGEFNLAWSLTPLPGRPTAFFDHTHNLPLQLLVELGLPLGLLVLALLLWALLRAVHRAWQVLGERGHARRAALVFVAMVGLHSLLEYPLWYAYFLLPAAWAWGFVLAGEPAAADTNADAHAAPARPRAGPSVAWLVAGGALSLAAVLAVVDYARVASIFAARPGLPPLAERIAAGQRSWLFAHHADYARVTAAAPGDVSAADFGRTVHYLLDTRLAIAWAQALAAQGHVDEARHLAARLREFHRPEAQAFLAVCDDPAAAAQAFQCQPPGRALAWRELLR